MTEPTMTPINAHSETIAVCEAWIRVKAEEERLAHLIFERTGFADPAEFLDGMRKLLAPRRGDD